MPVSAFFEWRSIPGQTKKEKLRFTSPDAHPLALAGLWEHWQRPETGEAMETYTVITTTTVAPTLTVVATTVTAASATVTTAHPEQSRGSKVTRAIRLCMR